MARTRIILALLLLLNLGVFWVDAFLIPEIPFPVAPYAISILIGVYYLPPRWVAVVVVWTMILRLASGLIDHYDLGWTIVYVLTLAIIGYLAVQLAARMRREADLKSTAEASQKYVTDILESIDDAFVAVDNGWRYTYVNREAERLLGKTREDLSGKNMWEAFPDSASGTGFQELSRAMKERVTVEFQEFNTLLNVWLESRAYASKDGLSIYFHDVTERKRAEMEREQLLAEARQSEAQLRTMADAIPQLVWIAQRDGFIFWYNRRWYEYTGTTPERMEGWGWQSVHDPEMLPSVLERWKRSIDTGEPFEMEFPLRGADGRFRWFLTRVLPFKDDVGRVVRWFGTNTDISYRREADAEREQLLATVQSRAAELAFANKELETFSYSVSHDLRAPLRHIDGFSKILQERYADRLDDEGKRYLRLVSEGSQKMGELIDAMLTLSRATRAEMRRRPVNLSELAETILAELHREEPERQAEFIVAPGMIADGDPALLRNLLENLLGNAWKFTSKQPVTRIEFGASRQDGASAYSIRDNGAGFDMAYADKLFAAFQRLHSAQEYPGTGIGLATVQRIVHRHGGRVWAEGEVGQGATFYFTLG